MAEGSRRSGLLKFYYSDDEFDLLLYLATGSNQWPPPKMSRDELWFPKMNLFNDISNMVNIFNNILWRSTFPLTVVIHGHGLSSFPGTGLVAT